MRRLLIQGAQAVVRMGHNTALGKWGWKLFARNGHRNIAVSAVARKLVVQVWHLLSGNSPLALDTSKSVSIKLQKVVVMLGKELRSQMGLFLSLRHRHLSHGINVNINPDFKGQLLLSRAEPAIAIGPATMIIRRT